jgi:hypothetical protein
MATPRKTMVNRPMKAKGFAGLTAMLVVLVVLLVARWPATQAQSVASITLPEPGSTKLLYPGCNNITLTFPEGTSSTTVVEAVTPRGGVNTMWRYSAAERRWDGFSSPATGAKDLLTVGFLDAVWLCIAGQPATPTATATAPSVPAATTSPTPKAATSTPTATGTASSPTATTTATTAKTPTASATALATVAAAVWPPDALSSFHYRAETTLLDFSMTSEGDFKAPDRLTCVIGADAFGQSVTLAELVVIGNDAWMKADDTWTAVPATDANVVENLKQCPGSPLFWEAVKVPSDLSGVQGQVETVNGVQAVRLSLENLVTGLPILGLGVPGLEGVTVYDFDMWLARDGGWVVRIKYDIGLPSDSSDGGGGELRVQMQVDVTQPNEPSINVEPP